LPGLHRINKDVLAFHFSKDGKLISQFGLDTRENNSYAKDYGAGQYFIEGANPQNLYWILLETNGMWEGDLLQYPRIGKINIEKSEISEFTTFGNGEFFLDDKFPYMENTDDDKIIFFGSNKMKRIIRFSRITFE
jgi:hypothetical protein